MSDETGTGRPPGRSSGEFEPVRGTADLPSAAPANGARGKAEPSSHGQDNDVTHASGRGSKALKIVVFAVVILILAGIGALTAVLLSRAGVTAEQPTVTVTVTATPPTATAAAIEIPAGSEFWNALPHTVGGFAVQAADAAPAGSSPILAGSASAPLEAYTWTYTDGNQQVVLTATQWATTDEAAGTFTAATADAGAAPQTVNVNGAPAGSLVRSASDGGETITWSNGTAVFSLSGPRNAVRQFYGQFPF